MTVVNLLPNGYIMVTLSPREAVMLMDQILPPDGFPWQTDESQIIAQEVRSQLKGALQMLHTGQMEMLKGMLPQQRPGEEEPPPPPPPQWIPVPKKPKKPG